MYHLAKSNQGYEYKQRLANGGIKGSGWVATGIGVLAMTVILVALFTLVLIMPQSWLGEEL